MKKASMNLEKKKPGVEINRPPEPGKWQRPDLRLALYLLLIPLMWFWWQSDVRLAQEEVPYSEFLKYLDQDQVDKVLVDDTHIRGTLKLKDEKTGKPRVIVTVPLANIELAGMLQKHSVEYTVRYDNHWLASVLSWILPFGLLFLLWSWMGRRMSGAAGGRAAAGAGSDQRDGGRGVAVGEGPACRW